MEVVEWQQVYYVHSVKSTAYGIGGLMKSPKVGAFTKIQFNLFTYTIVLILNIGSHCCAPTNCDPCCNSTVYDH